MYSITEFTEKIKLIRDPVYGFIEVPEEFLPVLDHKLVQRLRWISQLPLEQLVYPSAQHSRFEHSIGVMYLSMQVAMTLIKDNYSWEKIEFAFEKEFELSSLKKEDRKKFFVFCAGICGLLHDLGHAPFSHTLEDAICYTQKDISYHHETVTFFVAKKVLEDYNLYDRLLAKTVLTVLNKSLGEDNISPLKKILRSIIDGVIDSDKGDYLLRDSYHCGVGYGHYDLERLWRHVRITSDWKLGITEKGAVEAWNLRLARFKMYKNVYKHHVRNITDALLIDILSKSFDYLDEEKIKDILPTFQLTSAELTEEEILRFSLWTDNEILRKLTELQGETIKSEVENFMKRRLPGRFLSLFLEEFGIAEKKKEEILRIKEILKSLEKEKGYLILFLVNKEILPPVFTEDVQRDLLVVMDNGEEIPLAEYLSFSVKDEDLEKYATPRLVLEIFVERNASSELKDIIRQSLKENLLKE
jgi:HD superfamily phosphohydrolase